MTDEGSTELNNCISRTIFDERIGISYHFSPDVDSNCLSSRSNADSGVTSDLDRAVAALEARSSNLLERSFTSENATCSSSKQDTSARRSTVPAADEHDEETTKPRDFSELKAMFSRTDTNQNQNMLSTRKGKLRDSNLRDQKPLLDTVRFEHEELDSSNGTSRSERDSIVTRMKRNFETTIKTGIEKTSRIQKKPVSFEVSLDDDVTGDSSSADISHDPSHSQPIIKETESTFSASLVSASKDSPSSLEPNNERMKEKEMLTDSLRSISFDITFDEIPPKRASPKTMPKTAKEKRIDHKMAEESLMESKTFENIDEGEPTLDSQEKVTGFSTNEKYTTNTSCSLEVCLADAVQLKDAVQSSERETVQLVDEGDQTVESQEERKSLPADGNSIANSNYSFEVSFEEDSPKKLKCRERLNKLLVRKPCRTVDGPPGKEVTVSRNVCENEQNGHVQEKTSYTDNEMQAMTPREPFSPGRCTTINVGFDKETAPETTKEHFEMGNGKADEREKMKKQAQGISFDICFNDDSFEKPKLNRKPKLTPKHIRLKMTKKQQEQPEQNNKNEIKTIERSNVSLSVLPTSSSHCLKELNERNTYTLDEVSSGLQSACEKGLTLEDALDDLAKQQETREQTGITNMTLGSAEVNSAKRGTYSLDEVASCLVSAADKGLTVAEALDNLANSEEKGKLITLSHQHNEQDQTSITSTRDTSTNRVPYDMNKVPEKIDDEKDKGNSLEEALIQLLDEVETVVMETQTTANRGTYDLENVSKVVEEARDFGIPVEKTLEKIATLDDDSKTTNRAEVTATINERESVPKDKSSIEERKQLNLLSEAGKRGTYTLDDVEKQLEKAADEGSSVVDTLSDISKLKLPETIISSKINGADSGKIENPFCPARNTYTLDEVAQSLELAKSKGIPIVEALSNISTERLPNELTKPGSRETYTLDEVAQSLETAREKGLPIVMALENLVINGGGSLRGPAEVAVHRRQGKLTNRKTYALASPLETIGEEKQLRLFDGTSRKLLPPTTDYLKGPLQPRLYDDPENTQPSGKNVVHTLDLLTSACEALLKTTGKRKESDEIEQQRTSKALGPSEESRELRQQFKAESRDSGISFPGGPSERGTYSLDEVSETLEGATKKGIPVIDALGSLTAKEHVKKYRIPRALRKAESKSESSLDRKTTTQQESSRQTYSLDNVSNSMEDAKAKGIPVIAALDELTNSLAKFSATRPTPGKPLKKPDRPSIARKKEAARQERANVRSEVGRETQKTTGSPFPISYPPAMRNSYSLDDVASAFEKAYQTGIPFQDVLEGMHSVPGDATQQEGHAAITRSTGSLKSGKDYSQSTTVNGDYSRKTQSASSLTKTNEFSIPTESDSSLDGKTSSPPRKSSTSSEGSLTCSSSYGSDVSVNRDSSPTEELSHALKVSAVRKQKKRSNGPFQLKKGGRRNSPANLRQQNTSPSSLQGDSSHDSEQSSQTKRGTYDLKKIGDELDKFKVQGVPVVQGLDKLVTDINTVGKVKSRESTNTGAIPKRGTYSLDNVSRELDNKKDEGDSVIHALGTLSSKPMEFQRDSRLASENNSRNTFTLDHVDVSIADAEKRGIPVVEALDKLSYEERPVDLDKTESCTQNRKPTAKASDNTQFLIERFPSKTEKAPKFRVEKGTPVQVREEQKWEHRDLDNYPTRDGGILCYENSTVEGTSTEKTQLKEEQTLEDSASQPQISTEQTPAENEVQVAVRRKSRPRWQRSGSYVEALESFEERLTSDQDLASSEPRDSIPVKESDYLYGNYDTMHPEGASKTSNTSPRGRSTWRPSGSVLDEILNLMDQHEEQGLSIADALEKAAELSEQQGGSEGAQDKDTHRRRAEQTTFEQESQLHGYRVQKAHDDNFSLQEDPSSNRLRHCWVVEKPTLPPSVAGTARSDERHVTQAGVMTNENENDSSKKGLSMFIADETVEGLTPEQQKKRDRFLRNRQKKMEEEKARRELENEKKRQREVRQQDLEAQKRVRHIQPEEHSRFADYTSPPRIIKSSGKSNRKMISNALSHACLSGAVNNENRERCLQAMSDSQGSHFIILLKDGLRFRGLFVYSPENEQAYKIHGTGPKIISSNMVDCVYKYNSGSKEFIKIPSKTLSISVDGVAINKVYWQANKPNVASKTQSNLKRPPRLPQR